MLQDTSEIIRADATVMAPSDATSADSGENGMAAERKAVKPLDNQDREFMRNFGFLFLGYKRESYWFEVRATIYQQL